MSYDDYYGSDDDPSWSSNDFARLWEKYTQIGQNSELPELEFANATIGNQPETPMIKFVGGTQYWSQTTRHAIQSSYVRGIGRKRWNLQDSKTSLAKGRPDFEIPLLPQCRQAARTYGPYANNYPWCLSTEDHFVSEEAVYVYCTDVLKMEPLAPTIVEKEVIVEKVIEKGYVGTFEKQEALAFALSRELHVTQEELRRAHFEGDADYALRLVGRSQTIRELMADLGVAEIGGTPSWMLPRKDPEGDQMEMFDAVRE